MLIPYRVVDEFKAVALPGAKPEQVATKCVSKWLSQDFVYQRDAGRTAEGIPPHRWKSRSQLEQEFRAKGRIVDDCDGWAFAAVCALADLGIRARVIAGWTEPIADELDDKILPRYHMNAQTISGYVTDSRFPGQVLTWDDPELNCYTPDKMSGFFGLDDAAGWVWTHTDNEGSIFAMPRPT